MSSTLKLLNSAANYFNTIRLSAINSVPIHSHINYVWRPAQSFSHPGSFKSKLIFLRRERECECKPKLTLKRKLERKLKTLTKILTKLKPN